MPKKWVEKKLEKILKMLKIIKKNLKIQQKHQLATFFYIFFLLFSTHFFGIFELRWQCSKFWLRWINFIFSKWLSYSRFTKSVLPSSQVQNVTAYHPSTIYILYIYSWSPNRIYTLWFLSHIVSNSWQLSVYRKK